MSKKLPITKRLWVVDNGSIYTADTVELKIEFSKKSIQVREAVAFNVGDSVAHAICETHNAHVNWMNGVRS